MPVNNLRMLSKASRVPAISSFDDARNLARRKLPKMIFDFVDGGAGGEVTIRANRAGYEQLQFEPRWLSDVATRDTATTVLGEKISMPIMLSPAGLAGLVHRDGELAAARAAGNAGTVCCVSTGSTYSLEEIADVATGPLWFQLYLWRDDKLVESLVERARASGYRALIITVDVPVVGNTERNFRNGASLPPKIRLANAFDVSRRYRWLYHFLSGPTLSYGNLRELVDASQTSGIAAFVERELANPSATWDDVAKVRRLWDGPLIIKGVMSVHDARAAVQSGADAVYVSNHGGRQLDGLPATVDVLPSIVEEVGDRVEVLVDGGVEARRRRRQGPGTRRSRCARRPSVGALARRAGRTRD